MAPLQNLMKVPSVPSPLAHLTHLPDASLVAALGVQGHPWQMCDTTVYEYLITDFEKVAAAVEDTFLGNSDPLPRPTSKTSRWFSPLAFVLSPTGMDSSIEEAGLTPRSGMLISFAITTAAPTGPPPWSGPVRPPSTPPPCPTGSSMDRYGGDWRCMRQWLIRSSQVAGYIKTVQNFTWMSVINAGHMVPMDQPFAALTMLNTFMANQLPQSPTP